MQNSRATVYHVQRNWWIWAWLCLSAGVAGFVLLIGWFMALAQNEAATSDEVGSQVCCMPLVGIALLLLIRYALYLLATRLVVTERGLEYHAWPTHLRVTWREVRSLCVVKWQGRWLYDGLWVTPQNAPAPAAIPLALFDAGWPQGTLAATLQQRAPHLFAPAGPQPAPPPPPAPRRRRRKHVPVAPPADPGDTQIVPPGSVYNTQQPDPPADPHGPGVETIRF